MLPGGLYDSSAPAAQSAEEADAHKRLLDSFCLHLDSWNTNSNNSYRLSTDFVSVLRDDWKSNIDQTLSVVPSAGEHPYPGSMHSSMTGPQFTPSTFNPTPSVDFASYTPQQQVEGSAPRHSNFHDFNYSLKQGTHPDHTVSTAPPFYTPSTSTDLMDINLLLQSPSTQPVTRVHGLPTQPVTRVHGLPTQPVTRVHGLPKTASTPAPSDHTQTSDLQSLIPERYWPYVVQIDRRMLWVDMRIHEALKIVRARTHTIVLKRYLTDLLLDLIKPVEYTSTGNLDRINISGRFPIAEFSPPSSNTAPQWPFVIHLDERLRWIEDRLHDALHIIRLRRDPGLLRRSVASILLEILQPAETP
ncbi:hypothetical protein BDZ89DRAFT_1130934 [Hymenopellis radicata]|nr:hypothetical protein BDZ89DRAFT_1130934 [Hymenopellis radicata]